jgi:hypothetical protein
LVAEWAGRLMVVLRPAAPSHPRNVLLEMDINLPLQLECLGYRHYYEGLRLCYRSSAYYNTASSFWPCPKLYLKAHSSFPTKDSHA